MNWRKKETKRAVGEKKRKKKFPCHDIHCSARVNFPSALCPLKGDNKKLFVTKEVYIYCDKSGRGKKGAEVVVFLFDLMVSMSVVVLEHLCHVQRAEFLSALSDTEGKKNLKRRRNVTQTMRERGESETI